MKDMMSKKDGMKDKMKEHMKEMCSDDDEMSQEEIGEMMFKKDKNGANLMQNNTEYAKKVYEAIKKYNENSGKEKEDEDDD